MARSKEFDENEVLDKAMKLFWVQGYEKTSMNDLVEQMGIHRRSLYDTFTDKHTLFLKAIERFGGRSEALVTARVRQAATARQALESIYDYVIYETDEKPPGCLLVNSATELATRDEQVDAKVVEGFQSLEQLLKTILVRGQQEGECTKRVSAEELAEYLHNTLIGLRVMARTSVSKEKLKRIANQSIALLHP